VERAIDPGEAAGAAEFTGVDGPTAGGAIDSEKTIRDGLAKYIPSGPATAQSGAPTDLSAGGRRSNTLTGCNSPRASGVSTAMSFQPATQIAPCASMAMAVTGPSAFSPMSRQAAPSNSSTPLSLPT
jgi:hypothetical protein